MKGKCVGLRGIGLIRIVWFLAAASGLEADAAPAVTGFSPSAGGPGTLVTVNGSGFLGAVEVRFNQQAAQFTVVSSGSIRATVPLDATTGPITVFGPSGFGSSVRSFLVAPRVDGFSPGSGLPGRQVTITGLNFEGTTRVTFGGVAGAFAVVSPSQINATVPSGARTGLIEVQTAAGRGGSSVFFAVGDIPGIVRVDPLVGDEGDPVVIEGVNLGGITQVLFNGTNAAFTVVAPTQINTLVPVRAATGPLVVRGAGGSATSSVPFVVTGGRPFITGIEPLSGSAGDTVVVRGGNFVLVREVRFAGTNAVFTVPSTAQLNATVPPGALSGFITVSNAFGSVTSSVPFAVRGLVPSIAGFEPGSGKAGSEVVIVGERLDTVLAVLFAGSNALFAAVGPTQLRATVPVGAISGLIVLTNLSGSATSAAPFTVIGDAPSIASFEPLFGGPGTAVTVRGANFSGANHVDFGGVPAQFAAVADGQINAVVPPGVLTGPVRVGSRFGTNSSTALFHGPPQIREVTPASGTYETAVTVSGTNFTGTTRVTINQVEAEAVVQDNRTLRVVVPRLATSGAVSVLTPAGIVTGTTRFRVLPRILSFTPGWGPVGTSVRVEGSGFDSVQEVTFNGVAATFQVVNAGELRATVPAGAENGPLRVRTVEGTTNTAAHFVVTVASDLGLRTVLAPEPALPGEVWMADLVLTNAGPSFASEVVVTQVVAAGLTVVSNVVTLGQAIQRDREWVWTIPMLTNGTSAVFRLVLRAESEGLYTNRVSVTSAVPDPILSDNALADRQVVMREEARTLGYLLADAASLLVLSWATSAVPTVLERRPLLGATPGWSAVTNFVAVSGGYRWVTNQVEGASRFYRLKIP